MKINKNLVIFKTFNEKKFRISMQPLYDKLFEIELTKEECEELLKELRNYVEEDEN